MSNNKPPRNTRTYAIRNNLNLKWYDASLPISKYSAQEYSIKTILIYGLAILVVLLILTKTPLAHGGIVPNLLWIVATAILVKLLASPLVTRRMGYSILKPSFDFLMKRNLSVRTNPSAKSDEFARLFKFSYIDDRNYLYDAVNRKYTRIYEVSGNSSELMFPEDSDAAIANARMFYKSLTTDGHLVIDKNISAQRITSQFNAQQRKLDRLNKIKSNKHDYDALRYLAYDQQLYLREEIAQSHYYKSLRQYFIYTANSIEAINNFESNLNIACSGKTPYINMYRLLSPDECVKYLHELYSFE